MATGVSSMPASAIVASITSTLGTIRVTVIVNGNYITVIKVCIGSSAVSGILISVGAGTIRSNRSTSWARWLNGASGSTVLAGVGGLIRLR